MARKRKSTISESIKQGFGSEAGKKLATIVFGAIAFILLILYGLLSGANNSSDSSSPSGNQQQIDKTDSRPSNSN